MSEAAAGRGTAEAPREAIVAPYGAWRSPLDVELLAGTGVGIG